MKHKKPTGNILFILTLVLISSVGIGFSSWILGDTIIKGDNGEVGVEIGKYQNLDGILTLDKTKGDDNTGISSFKFNKDGFINNNEIDVNAGCLSAYLKLDTEKVRNVFNNGSNNSYSSLYVASKLSFNSNNSSNSFTLIRDNYISLNNSSSNKGVNTSYFPSSNPERVIELSAENSINGEILETKMSGFSDSMISASGNSFLGITITYIFKINYENVDFETELYPNLMGSKFNFYFGIGGF